MKILLSNSAHNTSSPRRIYHLLHPEIGTVGATMQEQRESREMWEKLNAEAGNGMAEVRNAVMVPVEKAQKREPISPYAWSHKRR